MATLKYLDHILIRFAADGTIRGAHQAHIKRTIDDDGEVSERELPAEPLDPALVAPTIGERAAAMAAQIEAQAAAIRRIEEVGIELTNAKISAEDAAATVASRLEQREAELEQARVDFAAARQLVDGLRSDLLNASAELAGVRGAAAAEIASLRAQLESLQDGGADGA